MSDKRSSHPLARLFDHARRHRRDALLATLFSALNKLFDVLPEVLIGVAVDIVVNRKASFLAKVGIESPVHQLVWLTGLTVIVWVCESLFEWLYELRWRNLAQDLQHDLRLEAYAHTQKLDLGWFENRRTGNLLAVLNDDINQLERFLNGGANDLIQVFTSSLLVGAVFFVLTEQIAFLALLPVPFIIYGAFWFQSRLAPRYAEVRDAAGALAARLHDNLLGIATIQAYVAEDRETERIREGSEAYRRANSAAIRFSAAITPVIRMAILAGFAVTMLYGGLLTLRGELGVGSYSVLVYLTQRLLWPMTRLAEMTDLYQRSMASVDRVMNLLDTEVRIPYAGRALPRGEVQGRISFESVSFTYGESPLALSDVSFDVAAGSNIGFVGSTGGGKSTLVKLLLRFYEPTSGTIRLDGEPLAEFDLRDLRLSMAYVAQDVFLTDGTVRENIAYGLSEVSDEDVQRAASAAEAHAFISALPNGYDTEVGERGQKLSGGQRQRIALARALVRHPRILLLDEATSSVDNETEAAIQRSLARPDRSRTTLTIAHRLSTVRHADEIFVIEAGHVVERGTHAALLERAGHYAALWRLQSGEV